MHTHTHTQTHTQTHTHIYIYIYIYGSSPGGDLCHQTFIYTVNHKPCLSFSFLTFSSLFH